MGRRRDVMPMGEGSARAVLAVHHEARLRVVAAVGHAYHAKGRFLERFQVDREWIQRGAR